MVIGQIRKAQSEARQVCMKAGHIQDAGYLSADFVQEAVIGIYKDIVRLADPEDVPTWDRYRGLLSGQNGQFAIAYKRFFEERVLSVEEATLIDGFGYEARGVDRELDSIPALHFDIDTIDGDVGSGVLMTRGNIPVAAWAYNYSNA